MFAQTTRSSNRWPLWIGLGLGLGVAAWLALGGVQGLDVVLSGGNPFASPFPAERVDQPYVRSPLEVALELEADLHDDVDTAATLAFADRIATDLGRWMTQRAATADVQQAERALWDEGAIDAIPIKWASLLQGREVYVRSQRRLSTGPPSSGPIYVHFDEAALLFAHAAWRLDLDAHLVRSPVHHYVHLHDPAGDEIVGVEPTCIWRVDALGHPTGSSEDCLGPKLTFGSRHHPSGAGGIRNPDPLPAGAYEEIDDEALRGELLARLLDRVDAPTLSADDAASHPAVARAAWSRHLQDGLDALRADDLEAMTEPLAALEALRAQAPPGLPEAPDEQVLQAARTFAGGGDGHAALAAVFEHYEGGFAPRSPKGAAHAAAIQLHLAHATLGEDDWNRRVVPMLNWTRGTPEQFAAICRFGDRALGNRDRVLKHVPECGEP